MWRQQVRATLQVEAGRCAAEASVDITMAFEHVDRRMLLEEAVALGYPPRALMAALGMYAMKRRLVFQECVGPEMWPLVGHWRRHCLCHQRAFLGDGSGPGATRPTAQVGPIECAG